MPKLQIAPVAVVTLLLATPAVIAGPLHEVVRDGDLTRLQDLIDDGEDLMAEDPLVGTPLHVAAFQNNAAAARILITAGAGPNAAYRGGHVTPLLTAAKRGSVSVAAVLLEAGARTEATVGRGPLHVATETNQLEVVKLLLEAGADPNSRSCTGETPLHKAVIGNAAAEVVAVLVTAGADINVQDNSGETPLHEAAERGFLDVAVMLIGLGADVNGVPDDEAPHTSFTPLAAAHKHGHDEIAELLGQRGATE